MAEKNPLHRREVPAGEWAAVLNGRRPGVYDLIAELTNGRYITYRFAYSRQVTYDEIMEGLEDLAEEEYGAGVSDISAIKEITTF